MTARFFFPALITLFFLAGCIHPVSSQIVYDIVVDSTDSNSRVKKEEKSLKFTADTLITDTTAHTDKKIHRIRRPKVPWKAAVMSACFPGLGQFYNGKWWKVPIVWGAIGTVGYFLIDNHIKFIGFRDAYRQVVKGGKYPLEYQQYAGNATGLRTQRDYYQRTRDILIIVGAALWILNVVDASVDAHLSTFDVSEDLSLRVQPASFYIRETGSPYVGLSLSLHFRSRK